MSDQERHLQSLLELRESINKSIDAYLSVSKEEKSPKGKIEQARRQVWSTANSLVDETVNGAQEATRLAFMPWRNAVIRTVLDLDLFSLLDESATASELATKTGADEVLIARLMRVLTGFHIVSEVGEKRYTHTAVSRALATPGSADLQRHSWDSSLGCISKLPSYLKSIDYKNPSDPNNTLSHYATGTDFFAYLRNDPTRLAKFNSAMRAQMQVSSSQVPGSLLKSTSAQEVVIVDVGGGVGQVLDLVMAENPDVKGRFILQDLGPIAEQAKKRDPKFEVMAHDFFTAQPVHGARVYFMRRVLHDFPDSKCLAIISNIRSAMKRGHSKLLICEAVLPDVGCSSFDALTDISRITFSSMQRTEKQWRALLTQAGLGVVKIWRAEGGPTMAVIEAEIEG